MGCIDESLAKVFVTGDLNVDNIATGVVFGGITRVNAIRRAVGGSAYNATIAFQDAGFTPFLHGKIGSDSNGDLIMDELKIRGIHTLINRDAAKPTGTCHIVYSRDHQHLRTVYYTGDNANDYSTASLKRALYSADLGAADFIFASLHMYDQTEQNESTCRAFFALLRDSGAQLIVDIVPHTIYKSLNVESICRIVGSPPFMFIGEYRTYMNLIDPAWGDRDCTPSETDCRLIANRFAAQYFACRYGIGNISRELLFQRSASSILLLGPERQTGFDGIPDIEKPGFGDRLTADNLRKILLSRFQQLY